MERRNLDTVIPAKAGIHNHDVSGECEQRRASFCTVSGYGSWAPLRGPGMTVLDWFARSRIVAAALRPERPHHTNEKARIAPGLLREAYSSSSSRLSCLSLAKTELTSMASS